jgi:hypothetical protein
LLGVPWGFNFLRGKDYADMMAFAEAVWNAAKADSPSPMNPEPACQESARGEWLPIETAPKDGARVLLWSPEWQAPCTGQFYGKAWALHYDWQSSLAFAFQPTHWMPLPAPPQDERQGGDPDPERHPDFYTWTWDVWVRGGQWRAEYGWKKPSPMPAHGRNLKPLYTRPAQDRCGKSDASPDVP